MSYIALYRKWRPDTFAGVKGQEAIVQVLRNQVIHQRIGHAYLFSGTRGTGKTSIAKLFAKAACCENPVDGEPCGHCRSCLSVQENRSMDIKEIDAASNSRTEDLTSFLEDINYAPGEGRYRVYIIDEVHMLSTHAFNALLKTLEEPPSHVIFILATTEKHKVLPTILSRCQKYEFRRISVETIAAHLAEITEAEGIKADPAALHYIASCADGSMRDALSLLDQCIAFYIGGELSYDGVLDVLGSLDAPVFGCLLESILDRNINRVLEIIDEIINQGRELNKFLSDFLWYLRNLLIIKQQDTNEESLGLTREAIEILKLQADVVETPTLLRYIRILSDLSNNLRNSSQIRVLLEVGFMKLCIPEMEADNNSISDRLRQLESQTKTIEKTTRELEKRPVTVVSGGNGPDYGGRDGIGYDGGSAGSPGSGYTGGPVDPRAYDSPEEVRTALEKRFPAAEIRDLYDLLDNWNEALTGASPMMTFFLSKATPYVSTDSRLIQLKFEDGTAADYMKNNITALEALVSENSGKNIRFEVTDKIVMTRQEEAPIALNRIMFDVETEE